MRNFLNESGISLIMHINDNAHLTVENLIKSAKKALMIKRSAFFRYTFCFIEYGLINRTERRKKNGGFIKYFLTEKGLMTIQFFLENFTKTQDSL